MTFTAAYSDDIFLFRGTCLHCESGGVFCSWGILTLEGENTKMMTLT